MTVFIPLNIPPQCGTNQRRRKQFRAGGGGGWGSISKKGTLFHLGKQAEKPKFKK